MRGLSASQVLDLCEAGNGQSWLSKAGALMRVALPEADDTELRSAPVAAVDRALLRLRIASFGHWVPIRADCPGCAEQLEADIDLRELLSGAPPESPKTVILSIGDSEVECRAPTLADVEAVSSFEPVEAARSLTRRCLIGSVDEFDDSFGAELAAALSAADSLAAVSLRFDCVECETVWTEGVDAVELLWGEVQKTGRRLIHEVHVLAGAYGWSEAEILALSPTRRGRYLQLV